MHGGHRRTGRLLAERRLLDGCRLPRRLGHAREHARAAAGALRRQQSDRGARASRRDQHRVRQAVEEHRRATPQAGHLASAQRSQRRQSELLL